MKVADLLSLLSPVGLAALEAGVVDSLDPLLNSDEYAKLLAVAQSVREVGVAVAGDEYGYIASAVETAIDATNL